MTLRLGVVLGEGGEVGEGVGDNVQEVLDLLDHLTVSESLLGLFTDPAAGTGDDGTGDVCDVLGTHEVGVLKVDR
ncbi:hypothetical protein [Streptomyces sp. NPDC056660]|uniref:hypothetical protein n=1 Tax=Streptomyces sp. NPDC056660 TaxID=3345897 RepID=UPI00367E0BD3